jgi:hypothetical protein
MTLNFCSVHRSRSDAPQLFAGEGIERAKGLVQQQHLGLVDQRAANAGALLHAARQLPGELVFIPAQADLLQQLAGALFTYSGAWSLKLLR